MDLNGYLALNDAQIKTAEAQAEIAGKLSQAEIQWAQADHQKLENVRLLLNIKWDAEAEHNLLRVRNHALQEARKIEQEGVKLRLATGKVTWLLAGGGDWERIRDAWLAFEYLRGHLDFSTAIKATHPQADPACYDSAAWRHPVNSATVPYIQPHDPGALLDWARRLTYFPVMDGPAWLWIVGYLNGLDAACAEEAKSIQSRLNAAQKEARELQARDWDRLNQSQKASA
jgi:hypothetical protein